MRNISCFVRLDTAQRIQTIKALRTATGWGLKEAKDTCDAIIERQGAGFATSVFMYLTAEQFGVLSAMNAQQDGMNYAWSFSDVKLIEAPPEGIDITRGPVPSPHLITRWAA